jgi:uncharacterized protein (TIGR02444 family)
MRVAPTHESSGVVELDASDFWRFSLRTYDDPAIRASCLALQDSAGCDVNVILLLLYAATRRVALHASDFARIEQASCQWRESVVRPLRAARRAVRSQAPDSADAYAALKAAELEAEKVSQELLVRGINALRLPMQARSVRQLADHNAATYGSLVPMPESIVKDLLQAFMKRGKRGSAPHGDHRP